MDGMELRNTLMQTLVESIQQASADRDNCVNSPKYIELTGRLLALQTMLIILRQSPFEGLDVPDSGPVPGQVSDAEAEGSPDEPEDEEAD